MKKFKIYKILLIVLISLIVNVAGRFFAVSHNLPVWMDAFGTAFAAYVLGPVSGAAVGLSSNVIFNILSNHNFFLYGIVNAIIGIIVGIAGRKGCFESMFDTMTVSALVTVVALVLSTPLNFLYHNGLVGNIIGDGVAEYLMRGGMNRYLANLIGGFYIDFVDKVLTLGLLAVPAVYQKSDIRRLYQK